MLELPKEFVEKYRDLLGDQADVFFRSFNLNSVNAFRLNPLKDISQFKQLGKLPEVSWNADFGHYGKIFGESTAFLTGAAYSQEASAQFVARVVDAQPGEKILDLAAAPGGKTTQIAADMQNQGLLVANEINFGRAKILSENVERSGITNCLVTNHRPDDLAARFVNYFDKILLDAPCSGEGMFRKDHQAVQYWHTGYNQECADRQREILRSTVAMLRPGGQLIYSTCTFAPEEDEQIMSWLLTHYPEFQLSDIQKTAGIEDGRPDWADGNKTLSKAARLWPDKINGEGHFVAKLVKTKSHIPEASSSQLISNLKQDEQRLLSEFLTSLDLSLPMRNIYQFGAYFYLFPQNCPEIKGLKVLRLGLQIAELKNKRFLPAHSLALSLSKDHFSQSYELSDTELRQFVHGDVITQPKTILKKGWVLMTKKNNGIGFGRYSDHMIKNFYPKGLRKLIHAQLSES